MIKTYSIREVSHLLETISLTDLLDLNDLEEVDIVRYLINEGVITVPDYLENSIED